MSSSRPLRTIITVIMDVLVIVAVVLCAAIVVAFFGAVNGTEWGKAVVGIGNVMTLPLGVEDIANNYGGVFDVNAAATVVGFLVIEWLLSVVRRQA